MAFALGVAGPNGVAQARAEPTCACELGLRVITNAPTYSFGVDDEPLPSVAHDEDEWEDLWDFYGLPGDPPVIDHHRFVVFATVSSPECPPFPPDSCALLLNGALVRVEPDIRPLRVWIFAMPRTSVGKACPEALAADDSDEPAVLREPDLDESCYAPEYPIERLRAAEGRATKARRFWKGVRYQTTLSVVGGIDGAGRLVFGALWAAGVSRWISDDDPWYDIGNEAGLELRGRAMRLDNGLFDSVSLGLRPWLAHKKRWSFDCLNLKRSPALIGVAIPEAGVFHRPGTGLQPYFGWSAPLAWHRREFFYRGHPYLLREHVAGHLEPGILWLVGESLLVTLSLGVGLW